MTDSPGLKITAATRGRVLEAIDELRYKPNVLARGLRLARTWMLGLILPNVTSPVYGPLVHGAQARAEKAGYCIVLGSTPEGEAQEELFAQLLSRGRVDGLLVASAKLGDELVRELANGPAPVVVVNRRVQGIESSAVVDDAAGAKLATTHLLDLGHRQLAHIAGPPGLDTSMRRRQGFRAAVKAAGLSNAVVLPASGWDADSGYEVGLKLFAKHPGVTAVFAANALVAMGLARAASETGREIPVDLSVNALHDFPLASYTTPPLTTVAMPLTELGAAAVDLLVAKIEGRGARSLLVETPPELVLRGSTAPPRSELPR